MGVKFLEQLAQVRRDSIMEIAVAQHVIPNSESVDKILHYEAAIEAQDAHPLPGLRQRIPGATTAAMHDQVPIF
jgi:hypothetical protein